jgi:hypothetical protein
VNAIQFFEQMGLNTEGSGPDFADTFREGLVSRLSARIRRRERSLRESYPFHLPPDEYLVEFAPDEASQSIYLIALFISHAPTSEILPLEAVSGEAEMRDARDFFQICATVAAVGHTEGPAIFIGQSSQDRSAVLAEATEAWIHCVDGDLVNQPSRSTPANVRGTSVDIHAFRRGSGGGLPRGSLVGQAASGHSWPGKSAVPAAKAFVVEWVKRASVTKPEAVIFIPLSLSADADEVRQIWLDQEYVISRTRLAAFSKALQLQGEESLPIERVEELARVTDWVSRCQGFIMDIGL